MKVQRRFVQSVLLGAAVPFSMALVFMEVATRLQYRPTPLLLALCVGCIVPFAILWLLHSSLEPPPGIRSIAFATTWVFLVLLASVAIAGVEWSTYRRLPGSSTNPVAVVALPVILSITGVASYGILFLVRAVTRR